MGRRWKDLRDGPVQFFHHAELFHAALAQLRVAHDAGDDPIRPLNFLLDDSNLLRRVGSAFFQGALQRKRRVVDNGQRILNLMGKLGRQSSGGAQLAFAHGELAGLLLGPALPFEQHLHTVAAERHQQ